MVEPGDARIARGRTLVLPLLLVAAVAGLAAASALRATRESHEAEIRYLGLSFDGSEILSVDRAGTVKRWHAASGRYLGTFGRRELEGSRTPWVETGPNGEVLVPGSDTDQIYGSYDDGQPEVGFRGRPSAMAPRGEVVTVIGRACISWSSLELVDKVTRYYCWKPGVAALAVDGQGRVHALDLLGNVVTVGGTPPQVEREVVGGGLQWTRIACTPSGATLLLTDERGRGGVVFEGEEKARPLPEPLDFRTFGFLDEQNVVLTGTKGVRQLNLRTLKEAPYADLRGSMVVASARYGRAVVARGQELYMIGRPGEGTARPGSWRLRNFLF
jgi:hypothetical protein